AGAAWLPQEDSGTDERARKCGACATLTRIVRRWNPGFLAKCGIFASPAHVVHFHHAKALGELHAAGQLARELAERLPVTAPHDHCVGALHADGARPGREAEAAALGERDLREIRREGGPPGFERRAVDPDGALAVLRRIVHALHEVPAHALAVLATPDTG